MDVAGNVMQGKTCLVTGATSGIGLVTARELARRGAAVIIAGRSQGSAQRAADQIRAETGSKQVDYVWADLSSHAEIREMAGEVQRLYSRLDVLVNNAGAYFLRRQESVDGYEMTFSTNHLSYFLLTDLLLDLIKASAPARIINVSSNSHYNNPLDFDDLQNKARYRGMQPYGRSKFANVLFTYELARRLQGSGVTVNALHPGFVRTNMGKNNGWFARLIVPLVQLQGVTPEVGAETNIYLATSSDVNDVTGKYFVKNRAVDSDPATYDQAAAVRLLEISAGMVGR
jgi:NAD(P)-dependent dehydrogenase (short-subunit alcohol dehydrogenase family)